MRRSMLEDATQKAARLADSREEALLIRIRCCQQISGVAMGHPTGESNDGPLDINFDRTSSWISRRSKEHFRCKELFGLPVTERRCRPDPVLPKCNYVRVAEPRNSHCCSALCGT